jgi:hypothetical protein
MRWGTRGKQCLNEALSRGALTPRAGEDFGGTGHPWITTTADRPRHCHPLPVDAYQRELRNFLTWISPAWVM